MTSENLNELLEIITFRQYEECEQEWKKVLSQLRLQVAFIPAVQTILKQGHWREKPNVAAYIRKGAYRCAIRSGIVDLPKSHNSNEMLVSDLNYRDASGNLLPHDERIDRAITEYDEKYGVYNDYEDSSAVDQVSPQLMDDEAEEINWERVADLAGLDAGEKMVLELRLVFGIGREQALSICHAETDRKLLQAAWKRFERHQDSLKKVLRSGKPHKSRRINKKHAEDDLELVLIKMPDETLKISFVKLVPEIRN